MEKRSSFSGKIGFVLAAAGSAVGLGNIWRFPYLAAEYGGGIFLIIYIILVVTFGFTLMTTEIALGRKTGLSAVRAYHALNKKYAFVGYITSFIPLIIASYYCVIGGWVIKYLASYIGGGGTAMAQDGYFEGFIGGASEPVLFQFIFVAVCMIILFLGVKRGVEQANKILMPLLVVLSLAVAIYSMTLPGALEGVKYFLLPDFSHFSFMTVLAALGQMFYSMSLAMAIMITYGSYLKKDISIERSVKQIEVFDTGIAILAGLMIIPAVFAFSNGDMSQLNSGPGLMFITIPKVFESMGMGTWIGIAFFVLVLFAALTSAISLIEAVTSIVIDKFHMTRKKALALVGIVTFALGIPSAMAFGLLGDFSIIGFSVLDFMDFISNNALMPFVALMTCIFAVYGVGLNAITEEVALTGKFKQERMYRVMMRYIAPVFLVVILIGYVLSGLGVFKI